MWHPDVLVQKASTSQGSTLESKQSFRLSMQQEAEFGAEIIRGQHANQPEGGAPLSSPCQPAHHHEAQGTVLEYRGNMQAAPDAVTSEPKETAEFALAQADCGVIPPAAKPGAVAAGTAPQSGVKEREESHGHCAVETSLYAQPESSSHPFEQALIEGSLRQHSSRKRRLAAGLGNVDYAKLLSSEEGEDSAIGDGSDAGQDTMVPHEAPPAPPTSDGNSGHSPASTNNLHKTGPQGLRMAQHATTGQQRRDLCDDSAPEAQLSTPGYAASAAEGRSRVSRRMKGTGFGRPRCNKGSLDGAGQDDEDYDPGQPEGGYRNRRTTTSPSARNRSPIRARLSKAAASSFGKVDPDWTAPQGAVVLVAKTLTKSDTLGRVILPRVAVETNMAFLTSYRAYTLAVKDYDGRDWEFVVKSWANGTEHRRVYVLEQTSLFLRSNGLREGDVIGICCNEAGDLLIAANTPELQEATLRPTYGVAFVRPQPPPAPGKTAPLLTGNPGRCTRNPYCEKPCSHSGFCSGPRAFGPAFVGCGVDGAPLEAAPQSSNAHVEDYLDLSGVEPGVLLSKELTSQDLATGQVTLMAATIQQLQGAAITDAVRIGVQDLRARPWELVIKPCMSHNGSQLLLLEEVTSFLAQNGAKAGDTLLLSKQAESGTVMHLERHHPAASPGRARRQASLKRSAEDSAERRPSFRSRCSGSVLGGDHSMAGAEAEASRGSPLARQGGRKAIPRDSSEDTVARPLLVSVICGEVSGLYDVRRGTCSVRFKSSGKVRSKHLRPAKLLEYAGLDPLEDWRDTIFLEGGFSQQPTSIGSWLRREGVTVDEHGCLLEEANMARAASLNRPLKRELLSSKRRSRPSKAAAPLHIRQQKEQPADPWGSPPRYPFAKPAGNRLGLGRASSLPCKGTLARKSTLSLTRSDSADSLAAETLMSLGEGDTQLEGCGRTLSSRLRSIPSTSRFTPQAELATAASPTQAPLGASTLRRQFSANLLADWPASVPLSGTGQAAEILQPDEHVRTAAASAAQEAVQAAEYAVRLHNTQLQAHLCQPPLLPVLPLLPLQNAGSAFTPFATSAQESCGTNQMLQQLLLQAKGRKRTLAVESVVAPDTPVLEAARSPSPFQSPFTLHQATNATLGHKDYLLD